MGRPTYYVFCTPMKTHKQINIYLSTYLTYLPIDLSICICTYVWLTVITSTHAQHTLSLSLSLAHFTSSLHLQLHFTSLHVTPGHVTPLTHSLTHSHATCECGPSPLTRVLQTTWKNEGQNTPILTQTKKRQSNTKTKKNNKTNQQTQKHTNKHNK